VAPSAALHTGFPVLLNSAPLLPAAGPQATSIPLPSPVDTRMTAAHRRRTSIIPNTLVTQ